MLNAGSVVKSVQRGHISSIDVNYHEGYTINISRVNLDKSLLLPVLISTGGDNYSRHIFVHLYEDRIEIDTTGLATNYILALSWQVIEFY